VPILPGDTVKSLWKRIKAEEADFYFDIIRTVINEAWCVRNRRFESEAPEPPLLFTASASIRPSIHRGVLCIVMHRTPSGRLFFMKHG